MVLDGDLQEKDVCARWLIGLIKERKLIDKFFDEAIGPNGAVFHPPHAIYDHTVELESDPSGAGGQGGADDIEAGGKGGRGPAGGGGGRWRREGRRRRSGVE